MVVSLSHTSSPRQPSSENTLFTFKEAMSYLRVSRSTLYRLMWSNQLVGHKVGSTWRFFPDELRACIQPLSGQGAPLIAEGETSKTVQEPHASS